MRKATTPLKDGDKVGIENIDGEKHLVRETKWGAKEDFGQLHANLSGSMSTRNTFGDDITVEKDTSIWSSSDYHVRSSNGDEGVIQTERSFIPFIPDTQNFRSRKQSMSDDSGVDTGNFQPHPLEAYTSTDGVSLTAPRNKKMQKQTAKPTNVRETRPLYPAGLNVIDYRKKFSEMDYGQKNMELSLIGDQDTLLWIAMTDPEPMIRLFASYKIPDEKTLRSIMAHDDDPSVKENVLYRIHNEGVLHEILVNHDIHFPGGHLVIPRQCIDWIMDHYVDTDMFERLARYAKDPYVREKAEKNRRSAWGPPWWRNILRLVGIYRYDIVPRH
ncbi:hypothetical protein M1432_02885 [Patescibacteria group bacterium]|nr:hypothetical protein [Patescibacteria group bacterium]